MAMRWVFGLDEAEKTRAGRFVDDVHRRRFVSRRWALRCLLGQRLGVAPTAVTFATNAYGKPHLAPPFDRSNITFSTSHSGDLALIALRDDSGDKGKEAFAIDVERLRVIADADALVERFFSRAERRAYAVLTPAARYEAFWRAWVVKEAFIKALGLGLSFPLHEFDVTMDSDQSVAIAAVRGGDPGPWTAKMLDVGRAFRAAIVCRGALDVDAPTALDIGSLPIPD